MNAPVGSGVIAATNAWVYAPLNNQSGVDLTISGSYSGQLVVETSSNGNTWTAVSSWTYVPLAGSPTFGAGVNGIYQIAIPQIPTYVRVRAAILTSGAANVVLQTFTQDYRGAGGFVSASWRFGLFPIAASAQTDSTNAYCRSIASCPILATGNRIRVCYSLNAAGGVAPYQGETATSALAQLRCGAKLPDGTIIQLAPVMGVPGGSDDMSIVPASGQTVWFEADAAVKRGDMVQIATWGHKNTAGDTIPLNLNPSSSTTATNYPYDAYNDFSDNGSADCTSTFSGVTSNTTQASSFFGPCLVAVIPANPYDPVHATRVLDGDSTVAGQSYADIWRRGWAGVEAVTLGRPLLNLACPGEASTLTGNVNTNPPFSLWAARFALSRMVGYVGWTGHIWNDLTGGGTSSVVIANRAIVGQWMRDAGIRVGEIAMWPTATSTDNWSSIANETVPAYYAAWQAIIADALAPASSAFSLGKPLNLAQYMQATNLSGIVPGPVYGNLIWAQGAISSVNTGSHQITPKSLAGTVSATTQNGVDWPLNGTDPLLLNAGNQAGGTVIVMTDGAASGAVFPVSGCNATYYAVTDPGTQIGVIAPGDHFNLVFQLSQNPHMPTRQQELLGQQYPMSVACGLP